MENSLFVDIACKQLNCGKERICGDTFVCKQIAGGRRTIAVLSDGMGHGVKANILSTLTSTMLLNFTSVHQDITQIAKLILQTLPVCNVRKISYSTFTIVDIDHSTNEVTLVEYDNPKCIIIRSGRPLNVVREITTIPRPEEGRPLEVGISKFTAKSDDRVVFVSDGVTQSGQRNSRFKFGWGEDSTMQLADYMISVNRNISSRDLASQIVSKASQNDDGYPSDDMSCVALHFRPHKELMIVSCPPTVREDGVLMARMIDEFQGTRIVCGYPIAEIVAKELGLTIERDEFSSDPTLPPAWRIGRFDLVTEGIVTLNRVLNILEHIEDIDMIEGGASAGKMCRMFLRSDVVHFVLGGKHKIDSSLYLPDEFELRRNVLRRIAKLLETKFSIKVDIVII